MIQIVFAVLFLAISHVTYACSCLGQPNDVKEAVQSAYEEAALVVSGKVTSVKEIQVAVPRGKSIAPLMVKGEITEFEILKTWKGAPRKIVQTRIVTECCTCGMSFRVGNTYLLYLHDTDERDLFQTGICTRTREVGGAHEDIRILEKMPNQAFKRTI